MTDETNIPSDKEKEVIQNEEEIVKKTEDTKDELKDVIATDVNPSTSETDESTEKEPDESKDKIIVEQQDIIQQQETMIQSLKKLLEEVAPALEKQNTLIAQMKEKTATWDNKYVTLSAEFDNYRKRTNKEKEELTKTAASKTIISLLPTLDDFERAINTFDQKNINDGTEKGMILIYERYKSALIKNGLEEMKCEGTIFDSEIHEAITTRPAEKEEDKNKVAEVIEKWYYLNGKVIRHAKVIVYS